MLSKLAINDRYHWVRYAALTALAANYREAEGTLELIRDRVVNDPDASTRRAALTALAANYREADGTLEFIRDRAVNDPDPSPEANDYDWMN